MEKNGDQQRRWRRIREIAWPIAACLVAIFFTAQAWLYSGVVGRAGEWQFGGFDIYFPGLTILLLLFLLMIPAWIVFWILRRRRRRRERDVGETDEILSNEARYKEAILGTTRVIRGLRFLMVVGLVALVISLVIPVTRDDNEVIAQLVDRAEHLNADDAPVATKGRADARNIALLRQGIGPFHRDVYVAPLVGGVTATIPPQQIYFVEVAALNDAARPGGLQGDDTYLRRSRLPLELVALYRSRGIDVAPDPVILFTSRQSRDWPYYITAIQLIGVTLFAALFAGILTWRRNRMIERRDGLALPESRITRR